MGSEEYDPDNLLDGLSSRSTMEVHYEHMRERERELLAPRLPDGGDVLSVGCGWNPGRHVFPQPAWRMTGVEPEAEKPDALVADGVLEEGIAGHAGRLDSLPDASFDAVLYRLVLHHVVFQVPLEPVFAEAARLLRPGGLLVAVEPGPLASGGRRAGAGQQAGRRPGRARHPRRRAAVAAAAARRRPCGGPPSRPVGGDLHLEAHAGGGATRAVARGPGVWRAAARGDVRAHADAGARAPTAHSRA